MNRVSTSVYVVIGQHGVDVFSNMSKISKQYPLFTRRQIQYALQTQNNDASLGKYRILKLPIK